MVAIAVAPPTAWGAAGLCGPSQGPQVHRHPVAAAAEQRRVGQPDDRRLELVGDLRGRVGRDDQIARRGGDRALETDRDRLADGRLDKIAGSAGDA
jgi:hypothetical protein